MAFRPHLVRIAAACLLALSLAGCSASMEPLEASVSAGQKAGNVQAVPVAFVALEGAAEAIRQRFVERMAEEATARQLRPVEAESARYFVRGYLSASSSEAGGTSFTYVWDVFDAGYRRIQRLEDQISIAKRASDPWSLADDAVLASLASKSADDLAALVATLPEALAAAAPTSPIRSAALIQ